MKVPTISEFSAGGVVFRKKDGQYEFVLGRHSGYDKWVLPKGLVEEGEKPEETAVREVEEEVGVIGKIVNEEPVKTIEYFYFADFGKQKGLGATGEETVRRVKQYQEAGGKKVRVHKKVAFYLMEYISGEPEQHGWEMDEAGWFPYEEAREKLAFDSEKSVVEAATEKLGLS